MIKKQRNLIICATFFFTLLCLGIFGYKSFVNHKVKQVKAQMQASLKAENSKLRVMQVFFQDFSSVISLPARMQSSQIAEIRPQVGGIIKKVNFQEGAYVNKGDVLYSIDKAIYLSNYKKAKSNLKTAKENEALYKKLLKQNATTRQNYNSFLNAYNIAKGEFEIAKTNLERTDIVATISGFITQSNFTQGALISQTQQKALATITKLSPIYAEISIPAKQVQKIKNAKNLVVDLQSDDIKETGLLEFAEVLVNSSTDSVTLRAIFQNKNHTLLPGMYATAKINLEPQKAMLIPQIATQRAPDGSLNVLTLNDKNILVQKSITVTEALGDNWIATEGLENGETILIEGFQKAKAGSQITPIYSKAELNKS